MFQTIKSKFVLLYKDTSCKEHQTQWKRIPKKHCSSWQKTANGERLLIKLHHIISKFQC